MNKFRIYMDVDGVLNASVPHPGWFSNGEPPAVGFAQGYRIMWAPGLVDSLNEFVTAEHESLEVEFVWLTTWCELAQTDIAPLLGLNATVEESRVLRPLSGEVTFPSIDWKIRALIDDQLKNPSKFVWFEDEIDLNEPAMLSKFEVRDRGLLINPGTAFGIQRKHIDMMKAFAHAGELLGEVVHG